MDFRTFFLISEDIRELLELGTKLAWMSQDEIGRIIHSWPDDRYNGAGRKKGTSEISWETRDLSSAA